MMATTMYSGETKEDSYSHLTTKTVGSYYDDIASSVLSCVRRTIERKKNEGLTTFCIGDFGTADGIRSFSLIDRIIDLVMKEMGRHTDIIVYFEDQPRNDFNLLFEALEDKQKSSIPFSSTVYPVAIGKSMFNQCLPSNSLDILFSTAAVHWLSNPPVPVKNGLTYVHADKLELKNIRETAKQDWHNFVMARWNELKPGCCMVVHLFSYSPEDDHINSMFGLSTAWQRMYSKNIINEREFTEITINTYPARTLEEVIAPFDQSKKGQGWILLSRERKEHQMSGIMKSTEDRRSYADMIVQALAPTVRNTIFYGLSDRRSLEEKNHICDSYFNIFWEMAYNGEIIVRYLPFFEIVAMKKCII